MAHWAEIDENNVVIRVTVGDNWDPNGDEGYQWLIENLGGTWVKTSFNGTIRKNFAGVGYTYDAARDAFIAPKQYDSWILNEETCRYEAPVAYPTDGKIYYWHEAQTNWVEIEGA